MGKEKLITLQQSWVGKEMKEREKITHQVGSDGVEGSGLDEHEPERRGCTSEGQQVQQVSGQVTDGRNPEPEGRSPRT